MVFIVVKKSGILLLEKNVRGYASSRTSNTGTLLSSFWREWEICRALVLMLNICTTADERMILINMDTFREYPPYPFYPCSILRIGMPEVIFK